MQKIFKQINRKYKNFLQIRGFTLGLALIIVAATLLISISISTLLIRDIKNSASNTLNSIAYNLAESGLECISGHEDSIRYFDLEGNNVTGLFPTSTAYTYQVAKDQNDSSPSAGYSSKDYTITNTDNKNKFFNIDQVKCFGYKILNNTTGAVDSDGSFTKVTANDSTAPAGYYSAVPANNGVVTQIKIAKDVSDLDAANNLSFFQKYLKSSCLDIKVYSVLESNIYKKLIVSESSVPCTGKYVTKRLLVRYLQ